MVIRVALKPVEVADKIRPETTRCQVPAARSVRDPDAPVESDRAPIRGAGRNAGIGGILPRAEDGSERGTVIGGEIFGRVIEAWFVRVELEKLALAELYLQVVTCQPTRSWTWIAGMISEPFFSDWCLEGTRIMKGIVREMVKSGVGPLQDHQRWKARLRAEQGSRSVHEHELLCMALELNGCYDQLDLSAVDGVELVSRRFQFIEENKTAHRSATYEGTKFFVGHRRTGTLVAPELGRDVALKLHEEVSVMKERRKHAEERSLARGPLAKGGKAT